MPYNILPFLHVDLPDNVNYGDIPKMNNPKLNNLKSIKLISYLFDI